MADNKIPVWRDDAGNLWTQAPDGSYKPYSQPLVMQRPVSTDEPGAFQRTKGGPIEQAPEENTPSVFEPLKQIPPTVLAAFGIDPNSEHGVTYQMLRNLKQLPKQVSEAYQAERGSKNPMLVTGTAYRTLIAPMEHSMRQGVQEAIQGWQGGDRDALARGLTRFATAVGQTYLMRSAPENVEAAAGLPKAGARAALGLGKSGETVMMRDLQEGINIAEESNRIREGQLFAWDLGTRVAGQLGDALEKSEGGKVSGLRPTLRAQFSGRWNALRAGLEGRTAAFGPIDVARVTARDLLKTDALRAEFDRALEKAGFPDLKRFVDTAEGPRAIAERAGRELPYAKLQEMYTRLNDDMYGGAGPEFDMLHHALEPVRRSLANVLEGINDAAGQGDVFRELKSQYADFMSNFYDRGSPIRQLIDAETSPARANVLKKFAFDDTLASILDRYDRMGGQPGLGERLRMATRYISDMATPNSLKQVPRMPGVEALRLEKLGRFGAKEVTPTGFDVSLLGGPTMPMRRAIGAALGNPSVSSWLTRGPTTNFLQSVGGASLLGPTLSKPSPDEAGGQ